MSVPERVASLETKSEAQDKVNASLCDAVQKLTKHLRKIELIAIGALIVWGIERAPNLMAALGAGG